MPMRSHLYFAVCVQEERAEYIRKVINLSPEVYGSYARDNAECLAMSTVTMPFVKITQLCMGVMSACQVLFMISRAPRVPWEAIYLPATEMISYSLSYFGQGYVRLANGKVLPWCRMAAWLCTCPIMLGLVSNMALIKYKSQPLNPMMIAASIIRTVFGISATMAETDDVIWTHFFFAFVCFIFEMVCAYAIFALTIDDFKQVGSPLAMRAVQRLYMLRAVFFCTWFCFPVLWILSSTYLCVIDENASALLYLIADISCKNCYGLLLWATTWGILNGKWDREYARNRYADGMLMEIKDDEKPAVIAPPNENFDVKLFGTTVASVRRSVRRPRADSEFVDRSDHEPRRRARDYESDGSSDEINRRGVSRDDSRRDRDYKRDYDRELRRDFNDRGVKARDEKDRRRRNERRDRDHQDEYDTRRRDDRDYDTRMPSHNSSSDALQTQMMAMASSGNEADVAALLELLKKSTKVEAKNDSSMC